MKQLKKRVEAANQKIFRLFPQYKRLLHEIRVAKATTQGIKEILPRIENVFAYLKKIEDDLKIPRCHVSDQGTVTSQFTQVMEAIFHQEEHRSEDVDEQNRRPIVVPISSRLRPRTTNKNSQHISFGQAISRGNYDEVIRCFRNGVAVTAMISGKESAFRRACVCGNEKIVEAMLERMNDNDHETITKLLTWGCLQMVIANGNLKITEALVNKKPTYCDNLMVLSGCEMLPVVYAAIMSKKDIVSFLYKKTSNQALLYSDGHQATQLFCHTITNGMLDIALEIFKRYPPRLAVTKHRKFDSISPMVCLAECDALLIPNNLGIWKKFLYSCVQFTPPDDKHLLPTIVDDISTDGQIWKKKIGEVLQWLPKSFGIGDLLELKLKNWQARALTKAVMNELSDMDTTERENGGLGDAIFRAVKCGNREYLIDMVKTNPECLYCKNNKVQYNLFMLAVMFRKPEIFSLYYGLDERREYMTLYPDEKGESSLLSVVAEPKTILRGSSPSPVVAPLELQRELQWFQEMEVVLPNLERSKLDNLQVKSPWDKFQKNHAPLRAKAEAWMKGTATSCSVVAILIATIAFQAIFTVPGGVKSESGHPLNLTEASFTVFVMADFCAFFLACTATFIFLGILTARHSLQENTTISDRITDGSQSVGNFQRKTDQLTIEFQ